MSGSGQSLPFVCFPDALFAKGKHFLASVVCLKQHTFIQMKPDRVDGMTISVLKSLR